MRRVTIHLIAQMTGRSRSSPLTGLPDVSLDWPVQPVTLVLLIMGRGLTIYLLLIVLSRSTPEVRRSLRLVPLMIRVTSWWVIEPIFMIPSFILTHLRRLPFVHHRLCIPASVHHDCTSTQHNG